jgi:TatD DNase family protein
MRLVDSHGHLQADAFAGDAEEVLAAAEAGGLVRLLVPGWDVSSSRAAKDLAHRHAVIDASAGVHPHAASSVDEAGWTEVRALAGDPAVVALGETGLDYDRLFCPREAQLANLRRHLALALETGRPAILHCRSAAGQRDAQDDLLAQLEAAGVGGPAWADRFNGRPPAILHSFSGPVVYAEQALALGLAISFSGLVFRRGEETAAEVARMMPAERLLAETDSPYLSPPGAPRRRNEPIWVGITIRWLAERRGEDPEALADGLVASYDWIFRGRRTL